MTKNEAVKAILDTIKSLSFDEQFAVTKALTLIDPSVVKTEAFQEWAVANVEAVRAAA